MGDGVNVEVWVNVAVWEIISVGKLVDVGIICVAVAIVIIEEVVGLLTIYVGLDVTVFIR